MSIGLAEGQDKGRDIPWWDAKSWDRRSYGEEKGEREGKKAEHGEKSLVELCEPIPVVCVEELTDQYIQLTNY